MPNPHFRVQVISRSAGRSVIASAAYGAGEILHDERAGKTFNYSRKKDVIHAEIIAPDDAPTWANDRTMLWGQVEASEARKDAQLARNIIAALPRELDTEQNIALVRGFIQENFTSKGVVVDYAIHEPDAGDGYKNPHAHILVTMRPLEGDTFGRKNREWNSFSTLHGWRGSWEEHTNRSLELAGREERVSLESYRRRGINKQAQIHLGENLGNLEKMGVHTKLGNKNRRIQHENVLIEMFGQEAEERDQDSDSGTSDREITLGAFRSGSDDMKRLAESSLAASLAAVRRSALSEYMPYDFHQYPDPQKQEGLEASEMETSGAEHEEVLSQYVQSPEYSAARKQTIRSIAVKDYAHRKAEKNRAESTSSQSEKERRQKERDRDGHER